MNKILYLIAILFLFASCEPEIDDFEPKAGNADFSSYVAIGNSLTAGYASGDLYKSSQENSFPSMLADKFATVGGGEFSQPLMTDDAGFGNRLVLGVSENCLGEAGLGPVPYPEQPSPANFASIAEQGPFNNMGVPGAKSFHLVTDGYGQLNPYFGRFASDPNTSVLADAMQTQPTFFTAWVGNNDVLTYATSGGEADSITSETIFTQALGAILQTLTSTGAKGAIANVPDITTIPFFTTVPYNPVAVSAEQAQQLNAAYAQYNQGADQMGVDHITFQEGPNAMVIEDEDLAAIGGIRQIKENELVLLTIPQDSIRCAGWGSQKPVPAQYVLDAEEIQEITAATVMYNGIIENYADQLDLAHVDVAARMLEASDDDGIRYDGVGYSVEFVSGGLFSLDGVHLTGQGYAIVANEFIHAINEKYNAELPTVSATEYPGVRFP
ncbi:MAG TPA: SGNH/GDSL hydrolase family protein [Bacteroidales bacterium]|nr:SGNH/GDSL hydrolase family protein [Bacteroidales bacterium]